ncbi:hypothetical protein NON00_18755 [Roseomonas sp. GC11]|uniref:hypothetical protein n=1 Tax=Roseomonas sp. GC11 TaxID=2950546 RepID=UPI00210E9E0C|nr:hypothetical protein [Roseomonas sp. GC11]MCQ4161959.1 hypothetical protein [Roseomonas sp. GC11]
MRAPLRNALLGVFAAAMLTALAGGAFLLHAPSMPEAAETGTAPSADNLPLPPEPPRISDAPEYEACLDLLRADPEGALTRATEWEGQGGGDPARHCLALSLIALGEPERAAPRLERLAATSTAGTPARAAIYAQAAQAWMMAGDSIHAYGATTLALSLTPDDTALLVDRAIAAAGINRYADALLDLDHALATDSSRTEAWVFRAAALRHLDRTDEALRDIETALKLDGRNAEAFLERGILRQLKGDSAGARADWTLAVQLAPDSMAADLAMQNLALNEAGPVRR